MKFTSCDKCRVCNSTDFDTVISYTEMPLVAEPVKLGISINSAPLTVLSCKNCGYVFLREVIDSTIYNDYIYTPQASSDVVDYLQSFVQKSQNVWGLKAGMRGLELGSGDGSLCKEFNRAGISFVGIEPSKVLCQISSEQNSVETLNAYMNHELAITLGRNFDVVVVRHVLEHIDNFDDFFLALDECLKENGSLIIEVPYLGDIISQKQFFAFFFEHLSYFSANSLAALLRKYGFYIDDYSFVHPEGGSILIHATRKIINSPPTEKEGCTVIGLDHLKGEYEKFLSKFQGLIKKYGPIVAYGAGQRGITFLNLIGATQSEVLAIYDENPVYNGLFCPLSAIPVFSSAEMYLPKRVPGKVLILASSYDSQIRRKYKYFSDRFISLSELID